MKSIKNGSGITLVALVVTIIVMLILAGVAMNILFNENGLIQKAQQATGEYDRAKNNEKSILTMLEDELYIRNLGTEEIEEIEGITGVARIGGVGYPTLQAAVDAVPETNQRTIIVMLTNTDEEITVSANKNIVLALQGKTITNTSDTITISNYGELVIIKDGTITGTKSAENYDGIIVNDGNLTIQNGHYISEKYGIDNYGTLNFMNGEIEATIPLYNYNGATAYIKGGKISTEISDAICNLGIMQISGDVEVSSSGEYSTVYNGGKLTIDGGKISSDGVNCTVWSETEENGETAELIVNGGEISSVNGIAVYNVLGIATINNGTITSEIDDGVENRETMNINGGTMSSTDSYAIQNKGTMNINGGIASSINSETVQNQGTIYINGGKITTTKKYGFKNTATATIGQNVVIEASGTGTGISNSGTITINGGEMLSTGTGYAIVNNVDKEITIKNGKISSTDKTIINAGTLNIEGGEIKATGNEVAIKNNKQVNITGGTIIAENGSSCIYNSSGKTVVASGGTIISSGGIAINNAGILRILGIVRIESLGTFSAVYTSGTLEMEGGTVINSSTGKAINKGGGTVTITGGTVTPTYE